MSLWNIFKDFVTTGKGQVINKVDDNKVDDYSWSNEAGTVYRKQGDIITGSDGSNHNVVRGMGSDDGSMPVTAIKTGSGLGGEAAEDAAKALAAHHEKQGKKR